MSAHKELDAEIIETIRSGTRQFHRITDRVGMPFRMVDRRLQSLRKRGLIEYRAREWHLKPSSPATPMPEKA